MGSQLAIPERLARVSIVFVLLAARAAVADPKEVKDHVDRAMKAYKAGQWADALADLTAAYTLDPQPDLLFATAQVEVKLDRCLDAIEHYTKFLDAKPKPGPAAAAREAIDHCKKQLSAQPPPKIEPAPAPPKIEPAPPKIEAPPPKIEPAPEAAPTVPAIAQPVPHDTGPSHRAWYADTLGDVLVVGGLASGIAGVVLYRTATADLDKAGSAPTYQASSDLVDKAHARRTYAVVAGAGGVVLVGAGIAHYVLSGGDDHGVAAAPITGGAVVTWSSRF